MACPFFVPLEILNDGSWPHPARLPLGAGWNGTCCAPGQESAADAASDSTPIAVDAIYIREFCNLGYATGCPHLPFARDWDAVRFSVAGSSPEQIRLYYICEFGHAPVEHGTLTYDLADEVWRPAPPDPRLHRLASSYLYAYRIRQNNSLI